MEEQELAKRLACLELAVAHVTEALEQVVKTAVPSTASSLPLIQSHLRNIRENFNKVNC